MGFDSREFVSNAVYEHLTGQLVDEHARMPMVQFGTVGQFVGQPYTAAAREQMGRIIELQAEIARRGVDRGAGLLAWADRATGRPLRSEEKRRFLDAVRSGDVDAVPVEPTVAEVWAD